MRAKSNNGLEGDQEYELADELQGFGRYIDYLGDNYSIGWREKGFLTGFARQVKYFDGEDLLDPPRLFEAIWRNGYEVNQDDEIEEHRYDLRVFDEQEILIEVSEE